MQHVSTCLVCDGRSFVERYPATFDGGWRDAVPYFLTGRTKAVHGRVVSCGDCGFVFTSPQFTPDEYARIYAAVHAGSNSGSPPRARFAELAQRVRQAEAAGRFLDFGCGSGAFLDAMDGYDGIGFEVAPIREQALRGASLGLLSMEERAALAGGGLEFKSAPGQGTDVQAWFPLRWQTPATGAKSL